LCGWVYFFLPGATFVVKDQVGPDVAPAAFVATTDQEYWVLSDTDPILYDVVVRFDFFRTPLKYTSYLVALLAVQLSVTFVFTFVAPFAGLGLLGALGAVGAGAAAAACV
jgi:hypothetical protein